MGGRILTPLGDKMARARLKRRAGAYWRLSRRRFAPSRAVATATALVYFFTMVPGGPTAMADIADYFGPGHPRNNDQRNRGGQYSPEQLKSYLDYKERLAKSITQREQMLDPRRSESPIQTGSDHRPNGSGNPERVGVFGTPSPRRPAQGVCHFGRTVAV
jgi:hypothetical protein